MKKRSILITLIALFLLGSAIWYFGFYEKKTTTTSTSNANTTFNKLRLDTDALNINADD